MIGEFQQNTSADFTFTPTNVVPITKNKHVHLFAKHDAFRCHLLHIFEIIGFVFRFVPF